MFSSCSCSWRRSSCVGLCFPSVALRRSSVFITSAGNYQHVETTSYDAALLASTEQEVHTSQRYDAAFLASTEQEVHTSQLPSYQEVHTSQLPSYLLSLIDISTSVIWYPWQLPTTPLVVTPPPPTTSTRPQASCTWINIFPTPIILQYFYGFFISWNVLWHIH
jgi:hypothetical protein